MEEIFVVANDINEANSKASEGYIVFIKDNNGNSNVILPYDIFKKMTKPSDFSDNKDFRNSAQEIIAQHQEAFRGLSTK